MKTYLFYDIESTGLSKCFDQVLQFAAIRTDLEFNEIERHNILVKLNPDVIPSPYAMITHQISLEEINSGINELEAMEKIHRLMNTPGTISLGYNTLNFDDEFLRFSFYRNLLAPYTHQYANQCSRMDIYPMLMMYHLYKKDILNWPEHEGKLSLKLETLSEENQLATGQAHNALVDVEATVALAKILASETKMWEYLCGYFQKNIDAQRLMSLPKCLEHSEGLLILSKLGAAQQFQAPVLGLGAHRHYKNQTVWLRLDLPELRSTTQKKPQQSTWSINKKLGEPGFVLPPTERFLEHLSHKRQAEVEKNKQWLSKHPHTLHAIQEYYLTYRYPVVPNTDVDTALYVTDFWSDHDKMICEEFHQATPKEKTNMLDNIRNPHIKAMAIRVVGRHYPALLNTEQSEEFQHYLQRTQSTKPPVDFMGNTRYSKAECLKDIAKIKETKELNEKQQSSLAKLENLLRKSNS